MSLVYRLFGRKSPGIVVRDSQEADNQINLYPGAKQTLYHPTIRP